MKTFVKLSGLTDEASVRLVPSGGAAGFLVAVPDAPQNLSIEEAAKLAEMVPTETEIWAVTRDPTAELVRELFDRLGVDRIQVFGAVPTGLEYLETHHIVPSLIVPPSGSGGVEPRVPPPEEHPILHLDAPGNPAKDGSPAVPDWEICRKLVDEHPGRKLVLAGGLTPENVGEALSVVRPWGIDVSRGVEDPSGKKDPARIAAFLKAVEAAEG
ncbi:MAG: phosphoribosylanthranilate isomerase [Thermoplasmata archaeon]|nr:phosphoribosylanthranilate isomerase [Thermoplasmata archaeon]